MTPTINSDVFAALVEAPPNPREGDASQEDFASFLFAAVPVQMTAVAPASQNPGEQTFSTGGIGVESTLTTSTYAGVIPLSRDLDIEERTQAGAADAVLADTKYAAAVPKVMERERETIEIVPAAESAVSGGTDPAVSGLEEIRFVDMLDSSDTEPPVFDILRSSGGIPVGGQGSVISISLEANDLKYRKPHDQTSPADERFELRFAETVKPATANAAGSIPEGFPAKGNIEMPLSSKQVSGIEISNEIELTDEREGPDQSPSASIADTILRKFSGDLESKVDAMKHVQQPAIEKANLVEQVAPRIVEIVPPESGDRRLLKMRLNPAELGSVEIELERDAGGTISARINVDSPAAQHILVEGLDQLRDALQNAGYDVGDLLVDNDASSSGGDPDRHDPQQASGHQPNFSGSAAPNLSTPPTQDTADADGLVSLRA